MTTWLLGGGREEVGSQMNEIGLFGMRHSASVLSPARLKLLKNLLHPKIFNDDLVLQDHCNHTPAKATSIRSLLMQSARFAQVFMNSV